MIGNIVSMAIIVTSVCQHVRTIRFDNTEIDGQIWMLRFAGFLIVGAGRIVSVGVFWQIAGGKRVACIG